MLWPPGRTDLEVGAEPLTCPILKLGKLPVAGVDDGLDGFLGLFADGYRSIQLFIGEQAHKHLYRSQEGKGRRQAPEENMVELR